jgi:hypothetical protein
MKLFVFVDGSFANNKDFSSQIGYVIILANETSANKTSTNETSANETSMNKTSANETSMNETSANETSANETSANETSMNKTSANETSMNETSANETSMNETPTGTDEFTIKGNLIHYSSTKCKRVTRSVLASEIYGMVGGVDMAIAVNTTIKMITDQLGFSHPVITVCTDSYSLYECLVKLGTTKEKRLMIDIMALRQSYKRREIAEIRWINRKDNPADAMTKSTPNKALESFLDSNQLSVRVEGWVQR